MHADEPALDNPIDTPTAAIEDFRSHGHCVLATRAEESSQVAERCLSKVGDSVRG